MVKKKKKTGGSERDRGKKKERKRNEKKKRKKKRWTTFKLNLKKKKSILPPYIRSRAIRPPSCVHFYVPFCRISAIRYTDIRHEQHRHFYSSTRAFTRYTYLHTRMKKQTSKKKMMKTNCYALGYRVFKFYFQFTHFSNVRIFVINEELACRSHKDDDTRTHKDVHTREHRIYTHRHIHCK